MYNRKLLTVFTPTYNRKNLLSRLYQSLRSQTDKNFIWMIIDDGSSDCTEDLVIQWQAEKVVDIQYFKKENEGMHSAHNWAYDRITTDWNTCIDSDDKMPFDAVQAIVNEISTLKDKSIQCLVGLDSDFKNHLLGDMFPVGHDKVKINDFMKTFKIKGDKKFVFKTAVMKETNPYPIFLDEKLVPLSYKYLLAEQQIFFKPINKILCQVEYQIDGSTLNMYRQYRKNPRGFNFSRISRINLERRFIDKFQNAVHLVSGTLFTWDYANFFKTKHTMIILIAIPPGILLHLYVLSKTINNK